MSLFFIGGPFDGQEIDFDVSSQLFELRAPGPDNIPGPLCEYHRQADGNYAFLRIIPEPSCRRCGCAHLRPVASYPRANGSVFRRFRCRNCDGQVAWVQPPEHVPAI